MDTKTRGAVLVVAAVALLLATMGASAALAPDTAVAGTDDERRTLVGIQGGGVGWHQYGSVAAYEGNDLAWRLDDTDSYFDVTELDNGSVMAGFMDGGYEDCGPYESPCTHTGFRILDPETESIEYEYSFPVRSSSNSEVHDVEKLDDGEYLLSDMEHEGLRIVKNGEVVWRWNASSYYDAPDDATQVDWLHINDVDVIGEGQYLVSVRNANQILVVDRQDGVVETINADTGGSDASCTHDGQLADTDGDGEVRCGDPEVLDHQHNPQWLGGDPTGDSEAAVLVADSDNDRVVELHRENGEWEVAWTLERAGGIELDWPRDADRLANGNTLVTDTLNTRVFEITPNGTVVWSISTDRIPYEADREPQGEPPEGEWYVGESPNQGAGAGIPLLSNAAALLPGVFPWLPFWFNGAQLGMTLLSVGVAGVGARDLWRSR
ncbi:arylsulfotransferase family protein [Halolamina rubra]|uniref:arylsulfotransferase family protein n=1 Tax=Halolamina rubra TaxID=1380430 RepID=UPI00067847BE|nr:arylsulfotransferase family protein [Halolamina rubra]